MAHDDGIIMRWYVIKYSIVWLNVLSRNDRRVRDDNISESYDPYYVPTLLGDCIRLMRGLCAVSIGDFTNPLVVWEVVR